MNEEEWNKWKKEQDIVRFEKDFLIYAEGILVPKNAPQIRSFYIIQRRKERDEMNDIIDELQQIFHNFSPFYHSKKQDKEEKEDER